MKVQSVEVREFKRFTNLKIIGIPKTAKLVVLVGPNGAGKSSLFEAFNFYTNVLTSGGFDKNYHWKVGTTSSDNAYQLFQNIRVDFFEDALNPQERSEKTKKAFYFRSAYRHDPDFTTTGISRLGDILDDPGRPPMLISSEARVATNYQRIVSATIDELYESSDDMMPIGVVRERLIGKVREAMLRVFDDLVLTGPGKPMVDGTFFFEKGASRNYRYKNLSGGEKAAFDLLLDFTLKAEFFDNTIFCIDEPELHMHTRLQSKLIDQLYQQLPPDCQLWIATHSIGMTRRAMELHREHPEEVIFLDFEGHNFDESVVMEPVQVDRQFWKRVFKVALDDLAELVAPSEVVFCEGRPEGSGRKRNTTFDAEIYRNIFRTTHPDTEFIPLGGSSEIEKNAVVVDDIFKRLFSSMRTWRLLDRDDRHDAEMEELRNTGTQVLRRRDIESYLWDDEILTKLCNEKEQTDKIEALIEIKRDLLSKLPDQGKPVDDIKAVSGPLYVQIKRLLTLTQCGNTAEEFCKRTLAPLITPGTAIYQELEADVFGTRRSS